jgi:excisionase family DNA binding protein
LLHTERTEGEVPERPLTARQVAEALGVSVEAVRELCRRQVLEHFRVVNAIRIPRAEFERFVRENLSRRRARDVTLSLEKIAPAPAPVRQARGRGRQAHRSSRARSPGRAR